jgi:preprotein translocase subunit SecE
MFARVQAYFQETGSEMKRVSWVSLPELRESTWVVIVTVVLITIFVFVVDKVLDLVVKALIGLA